ncbi:methyltransferase domain-containing protein [Lysinibacillus agricola]|uniref:Methyltransferase domain-containing protein n=1 Tax=Lysinibacillus agricola TaxID=2590012 RepID=A0ABX7ATG0_9BACI|nr:MULTISPECIES: methyltransferase domain-containing protein [Lysinibacillus]QQP13261.1 methyltransferase domain-containing protein [Lysinibacillus agricola]
MSDYKMLNVGCGSTYHQDWVNVDLVSESKDVIEMDIRKGLDFPNESFDVVYCSHILEHLRPEKGEEFIKEMIRVLKPNGIIRVVVPNLETIVKNYLYYKKRVEENYNPYDEANYDWSMLELFDQIVRENPGGNMVKYMLNEKIINKDFIFERWGWQAEQIYSLFENELLLDFCKDKKIVIFGAGSYGKKVKQALKKAGMEIFGFIDNDVQKQGTFFEDKMIYNLDEVIADDILIVVASSWWKSIEEQLISEDMENGIHYFIENREIEVTIEDKKFTETYEYIEKKLGLEYADIFKKSLFRNRGEVHYWMYDSFSLKRLLKKYGVNFSKICNSDESEIPNFNLFNLDTIEGVTRKPDSLFIEGIK